MPGERVEPLYREPPWGVVLPFPIAKVGRDSRADQGSASLPPVRPFSRNLFPIALSRNEGVAPEKRERGYVAKVLSLEGHVCRRFSDS
jgi:hypothetical protein